MQDAGVTVEMPRESEEECRRGAPHGAPASDLFLFCNRLLVCSVLECEQPRTQLRT